MKYWMYENRRRPNAVPGATRKAYGTTWWGAQWLKALENIDYANRLPRGKTYANKGLAQNLNLEGNTITAQVIGSMPKPYKVAIEVPKFEADTRDRLLRLVTENPLFLSKLLNRELPVELHQACIKQDIHVFPRRWEDMRGSCSCPDWAVPCKHMAAVFYLIANEIDKNPFVVFDLHGFDLAVALRESGYTDAVVEAVPITCLADLQQPGSVIGPQIIFDGSAFDALDFSTITDCQDNLLRLLSEKPVFFPEGDFKKNLTAAYKNIAAGVESRTSQVNIWQEEQRRAGFITENVLLMLSANDGRFLGCTLLDVNDRSVLDFDSVATLTSFLESLPIAEVDASAPGLRVLHLAYRFATALARKGAFVPQLLSDPEHACWIRFVPAKLNEAVRALCDQIQSVIPSGIMIYIDDTTECEPTPADTLSALLSVFLGHFVQQWAEKPGNSAEMPRWFFSGASKIFDRFETREYPRSIQLWLNRFYIAEKDFVPVIEVLDEGEFFEVGVSIEDKTAAFEAPIPLKKVFSDKKHARLRMDALRDLSMIAEFFPPLNNHIASNGTEQLRFDSQSFAEVFFEALPVIRLFGIKVLLPKALQKILRPAASMSLQASNKGKTPGSGLLSFAGMIDFQWQIALGDQLLPVEAFMQMVKNLRGIVRLANGYAYVNENEIAALLEKISQSPPLTGPRLLQIAVAGEYQGVPVHLDATTLALMTQLLKPGSAPLPRELQASLRPYQFRGFEWLYKNTRLGFGSLIADDMGLGKTLQVITLLQRLKEDGAFNSGQKALVVVPTTLLTNWCKEIAKFAPALKVHVFHGTGRKMALLADADLLLTTYGVVRSDASELQKKDWLLAIIDEAQNIKNLETAQTKAIKKLKAPVRIAMTGTPVENRLSEYYSIFDFTNHGYLGSLKEFNSEFAKPIELERDHAALQRFQRVTAPFLLRRVKTDKNIISDLPDKIETNQFCALTPEQAALYQNVVNESIKAIAAEKEGGIKRQGLVLKMLTALKQICNHPAHFLKKTVADPNLSNKTLRLLDLMEELLENGEKALIFTQYREMGDLLIPIIQARFGLDVAFLHGGVSRKDRDTMVEQFQHQRQTRILLLSLKAGGTGLNLTAASNVIHYDLWWNPAVEAQATDRAFRIGQQRNVQVHRFITQGTFEEKIDVMIQSKKALANLTVSAGEKWVGDLSEQELRELVKLGPG